MIAAIVVALDIVPAMTKTAPSFLIRSAVFSHSGRLLLKISWNIVLRSGESLAFLTSFIVVPIRYR